MNNSHNHKFQVRIKAIEANGLMKKDRKSQSDPFLMAKLKGIKQMMSSVKTAVVNNNPNPVWNQELDLFVPSVNDVLLLKVYDKDAIKSSLLGMVEIPLSKFYQAGPSDQWLQLMIRKGGWKKLIGQQPVWNTVPGSIHVQIWFGNTTDVFPGFNMSHVGPQNTNFVPRSPMITGTMPVNSNSGFSNSNSGFNNTTTTPVLVTETTTVTATPLIDTTPMTPLSSLATPTYHVDQEYVSQDSHTGFMEVSPHKFQWYNNPSTINNAQPL